ncbi:hypothetical protein [Parahaliea aestuarii]|uniref:Uncharacterized protein n=1 Tax=Parahaliea aestuarii TaxID=1852021 RepID=A0A5C9A4T7_9GAMM|nr:hypothetical protein [Parahaliea aestuarii]TXS94740.1 hypothetical protein FVW59_02165 [Parahaliea aestuarii]
MGDILEFPSRQAQGLAYLDRQLRDLLDTRGADAELIDFAAAQLTTIYAELTRSEQYSFSITLPPGLSPEQGDALRRQIDAGLEGLRQENHAMLVKLAAQLVLAEVKLFQHERTP